MISNQTGGAARVEKINCAQRIGGYAADLLMIKLAQQGVIFEMDARRAENQRAVYMRVNEHWKYRPDKADASYNGGYAAKL